MAPWALMKKGTSRNSRSPSSVLALIQFARVQAGLPPKALAGIRPLCLHETASTSTPAFLPTASAAALNFS